MTLERYFGHICKSSSQFAPVNWLAYELWLFFSRSAETSAAGKCHEHGLAQALQHMALLHVAFAITKCPELSWHWDIFNNLSWILCSQLVASLFLWHISAVLNHRQPLLLLMQYISTCYRRNTFWAAAGIFSLLVELQHNCISVGSTQAFRSFLGAKVFLTIYKEPAWSILAHLLKAPGHSLLCLLPTCTQWFPRALWLFH